MQPPTALDNANPQPDQTQTTESNSPPSTTTTVKATVDGVEMTVIQISQTDGNKQHIIIDTSQVKDSSVTPDPPKKKKKRKNEVES